METTSALVTGGAIRMGKAIAIDLAKKGYNIALHYNQSHKDAETTRLEIKNFNVKCEVFQFDLRSLNGFESFFESVIKCFPDLNLLVNSASSYTQAPILETDYNIFDNQFTTNIRAPFFMSKNFALNCRKGNIINIIDNKVSFNQYAYAAYLLTKKSLLEFTKMAALEFAPNIRVNAVSPGVTLPLPSRSKEYIEWRKKGIPLNKKGETFHITKTIHFILENDFVTGQNFIIDGGEGIANIGRYYE